MSEVASTGVRGRVGGAGRVSRSLGRGRSGCGSVGRRGRIVIHFDGNPIEREIGLATRGNIRDPHAEGAEFTHRPCPPPGVSAPTQGFYWSIVSLSTLLKNSLTEGLLKYQIHIKGNAKSAIYQIHILTLSESGICVPQPKFLIPSPKKFRVMKTRKDFRPISKPPQVSRLTIIIDMFRNA